MRKIIIFFVLLFSGSVFGDTYPAGGIWYYGGQSFSTLEAACIFSVSAGGGYDYQSSTLPSTCNILYFGSPSTRTIERNPTCLYGGILVGDSCIDAPSCPSGQIRNSTGSCVADNSPCPDGQRRNSLNVCYLPNPFCKYPEVDNGDGFGCRVPECPSGEKMNYLTLTCELPPICASAEIFNPYKFICELNKLSCPLYSHANTANDTCLPDPPLVCPIGQHDDGTYQCIADDAPPPCKADEQKGYINGIPQCIKRSNLDTAQQAAADKADAAAKARSKAGQSASDAAADPTNQTKTDQSAVDEAAATAAETAATDSKVALDQAINKQIADNTREANDLTKARQSSGGSDCKNAPTCQGDPINCAILFQGWKSRCALDGSDLSSSSVTGSDISTAMGTTADLTSATVDLSLGGASTFNTSGYGLSDSSCPAPVTTQIYGGSSMTIDLSPFCTLAQIVGGLVMITAYFISLRLLVRG